MAQNVVNESDEMKLLECETLIRRKVNEVKPQTFKELPHSFTMRVDREEFPTLCSIEFPEEYSELRELSVLTKNSLKDKKILEVLDMKPKNFHDFFNQQIALIALHWRQAEIENEIVRFAKFRLRLSRKQNPTESFLKFDLEFTDKDIIVGSKIRRGDMLKIEYGPNFEQTLNDCRVISISDHVIQVKNDRIGLSDEDDILRRSSRKTRAYEVQPYSTFRMTIRSLTRLQKKEFHHFADFKKFHEELEGGSFDPDQETIDAIKYVYGVNDMQATAMWRICILENGSHPFILHGPCGTGKTKIISSIALCLMDLNKQHRILICAPTNSDADTISLKLMELAKKKGHWVLRLRSANNDYQGRDERLDPITCFDKERENFKLPSKEEYEHADIVVCTATSVNNITSVGIQPGFFSHLIFDEASLLRNGDYLIPIGNFADENTSVILCGDRFQMPPPSKLDESLTQYDTKDSVLKHYLNMGHYRNNPRLTCLLTHSYLLSQPMLDLIQFMFYRNNSRFTGLPFDPSRRLRRFLMNKKFPVIFIQSRGTEETGFVRRSDDNGIENQEVVASRELRNFDQAIKELYYHIIRNTVQANEIGQKMRQLLNENNGFQPDDVGIVSPYRNQTTVIKNKLKNLFADERRQNVPVLSVESFQGSTKSVVLLATTRTQHIGFMQDERRIYTAITRARDLLIVYGDERCLSKSDEWARLIEKCRSEGTYVDLREQQDGRDSGLEEE